MKPSFLVSTLFKVLILFLSSWVASWVASWGKGFLMDLGLSIEIKC